MVYILGEQAVEDDGCMIRYLIQHLIRPCSKEQGFRELELSLERVPAPHSRTSP